MAAAFLIARHRGSRRARSQIGFFVIINLVFTFSISGISIGGHLGGLIGGGLAALLVDDDSSAADAKNSMLIEGLGLVALCAIAVVGCAVGGRVERSRPAAGLAASTRGRGRAGAPGSPERLGRDPRRRGDALRVEQVGEQLDALDQPRSRPRERRGRVDGDDPLGAERASRSACSRACSAASSA